MIDEIGALKDILNTIQSPTEQLIETWQSPVGISELRWTLTQPLTGAAWAISASSGMQRATAVPAASENCRLVGNNAWSVAPTIYNTSTIIKKIIFEWVMQLTNVANMSNVSTFFGFTPTVVSTRTTNDIIGVALIGAGNALQTVTDLGGVETVNTGFGETLTNRNNFRMEIYRGHVVFFLNGTQIADHVANLPDQAMFPNFYILNGAGGASTPAIGVVKIYPEFIVRN
jgi:hypothetical protein